jgi:hypothetical protein
MLTVEIDGFGWAQKENLTLLSRELREGSYHPDLTTKTYIPKSSGLLRPITILRVKDAIVYQAIANVLSEKARPKLAESYLKTVFSNIVNSSQYPIFFRPWQYGFRRMNAAKEQAFKDGYAWIGELDVTSFYDLIDHELLVQLLSRLCGNEEELYSVLRASLSKWTIPPLGLSHGHGIPQGPLPSSFLAECVLHFLDIVKTVPNTKYFRYVDDIFVMAKTEHDLRRIFARLEIRLRELALAPHVKRPIQKINTMDALIFSVPSSLQNLPPATPLNTKQAEAARKLFLSCFHRNGELRREDDLLSTKLNYSLFRIRTDRRILRKVLSLIQLEPSSTDAIHFHLRKYGVSSEICTYLLQHLAGDPMYEYAIANCLQTLNTGCARGTKAKFTQMCVRYSGKGHNPYLRSIAVTILGARCLHKNRLLKLIARQEDTYVTEHLLLAHSNILPASALEQLLNQHIRLTDANVSMVAAYLLSRAGLRITGSMTDINPWATPILVRQGLTKKRIVGDRIGELLKARFRLTIPTTFSFRGVLTRQQYAHALRQLNNAEGNYATNRSLWVTYMDNFNQILLIKAYDRVGSTIQWTDVFGSIDSLALRRYFPSLAASFKSCHTLGRISPVPHAWSKTLGTFARDVKVKERGRVEASLRVGYQEFISKKMNITAFI